MSYIANKDLFLEIPAGNVSGQSSVNKFGRSIDVDTATDTDIWDGADGTTSTDIWVSPTAARIHNIVSTDTDDDGSPVGNGARTLEIQGLDTNWDLQTETVIMDGTTNVATSNSYRRIFRMKVLTVGSTGHNEGIITATAQVDGTITAAIQIGNNQTLMAIYTVPNGKTAYMTQYYAAIGDASPSGAEINIRLLVKPDASQADAPYQLKHIQGILNASIIHEFKPYFQITEKSDIVMRATEASDNNSDVSAGFDLILVDN